MSATPPALSTQDFQSIHDAVMETARGRWFLAEYARRERAADTRQVLAAIDKLQATMAARAEAPEAARIRMDLREMAEAIARTKAEIAAIKPEGKEGRFEEASVELDAIVKATETATGEILSAAETIQEIAWALREQGVDGEVCDLIDAKATDVYTACSFQDITGQRIRKVIGVLRFLEGRIDSMMRIWGAEASTSQTTIRPAKSGEAALLNGPARPGEGMAQGDVDAMMAQDGAEITAVPAAAISVAPVAEKPRPAPAPMVLSATAIAPSMAFDMTAPAVTVAVAPLPAGMPNMGDIEKLSFVEKVAITA